MTGWVSLTLEVFKPCFLMSSCLTTKGVLVLRGAPLLLIGDEQSFSRAFPLGWGVIEVHGVLWNVGLLPGRGSRKLRGGYTPPPTANL